MSRGFSLVLFPVHSRGARRRSVARLRFEACEPRRVLSATMPAVEVDDTAAEVWPAQFQEEPGHEGDVFGSVAEGRFVTDDRAFGYDAEPDTSVYSVGFDVTGLALGSVLELEVLQGVTFWNGTGSVPSFSPARGGVEMNFNNEADSLRIGATRNVGRRLTVGVAEEIAGDPVVHDHFDVAIGSGGTNDDFTRPAPVGIYVVIGRLVGADASDSAPVAFVFNAGATHEAHMEAVEFFEARPAVSVLGVETPSQANLGLGQTLEFTYRFSDPVAATGNPRLPLLIGGKQRFATLDRGGSSGANLVFSYTLKTGDNGPVRTGIRRPGPLAIQLPTGSRISGAAGGVAFPAFAAALPTIQALTTQPKVTRVQNQTGEGTYQTGAVFEFRLTWDRPTVFSGSPSIGVRAIRGGVLGTAAWVNSGTAAATEHVFRYVVEDGDSAPRGIEITGPIVLNGGAITDSVGNPSVLSFKALKVAIVRIAAVG